MNRPDWPQLKELFEQLVDLSPAERSRLLEEQAARGSALHDELERLLLLHDTSDAFLEPLPTSSLQGGLGRSLVGQQVGAYQVERLVAAGGMGVVYEARQSHPQRRVALKLMRHDLSAPDALRRFQFETEVLGRLQHPGIAQIYEAGVHRTSLGEQTVELPFFAMEFVEGAQSILAHAQACGLDLASRLALFSRVCAAVHHGHQKGIVHRDLKPSNILVSATGDVKVIDFGIARATDADGSMTATVGQIVGTLQYMSPEQLASDRAVVDTRTDVYGLGLVLYELLTGHLPYDVRETPIHEVARIVCERPPTRPSSRARGLSVELDWIVLKALDKDPERRYAAASELAADIARYRNNERVMAGPPSTAYRVAKFVRRNRGAVLAVSAVVVALTAGLIVSLTLLQQVRREQRIASETNRYLDRWLAAADPEQSSRDVRLLDLLEDAQAELVTAFADEPLVKASLQHTLGKSFRALGRADEAALAMAAAADTRRRLLGPADGATLASAYQYQWALQQLGRFAEAEAQIQDHLAICQERFGPRARATLEWETARGNLLKNTAHYQAAESALRGALQVQRETLGASHADTRATLLDLCDLLRVAGQLDGATRIAREAHRAAAAELGADDTATLDARHNLASVLAARGELTEAVALRRADLDARRRKFGPRHRKTHASMRSLADLLRRQGQLAESEKILREVLLVVDDGEADAATITTLNNLAVTLSDAKQLTEAEAIYRRAVAAAKVVFGTRDIRFAQTVGNLALCLKRQGNIVEAESIYRESLALTTAIFDDKHPEALTIMNNLATLLVGAKRFDEAEDLLVRALAGRRQALGNDSDRTLATMYGLLGVLRARGKLEAAEELGRECAAGCQRVLGGGHVLTPLALRRLMLVLQDRHEPDQARLVASDLQQLYEARGDAAKAAAYRALAAPVAVEGPAK